MPEQLPLKQVLKEGPKDKLNQAGMKLMNCFYCKEEVRERDLVKHSPNATKNSNQGDMLLICNICYDKIIKSRS